MTGSETGAGDAAIPDWYRTYVVGAGRLLGYAVGLFFALGPLITTASEAVVDPVYFSTYGPVGLRLAALLAVGLFLLDRSIPGYRVIQYGFAVSVSFHVASALLLDLDGFAAGSALLWFDVGLASLTAVALGHVLVFGGLAGDVKAAAVRAWRWAVGPLRR